MENDTGKRRGSSVKIFKIKTFNIGESLQIPSQRDLSNEAQATGTIKNATSTLKRKTNDGEAIYEVDQYTNTINESIRVLWEGIRDFDHYQRRGFFKIVYRKSDNLLFVFANNEHTQLLMHRLKDIKNKFEADAIGFDFEKIRENIPEIKNIWGVWEKVNLANKSVNASFGVDVDKSAEVKLSQATTVNVVFEVEKKKYILTISQDGRLSSKNMIKNAEFIELFDKYFAQLVKTK